MTLKETIDKFSLKHGIAQIDLEFNGIAQIDLEFNRLLIYRTFMFVSKEDIRKRTTNIVYVFELNNR